MTIKISIANSKGGTGKSTIATHIAAYLAKVGRSVLMVDMDPQGHLSELTATPKRDGVFELICTKTPISEIVAEIPAKYHGGNGWLGLLPGSIDTQTAAIHMQLNNFRFTILREKLHDFVETVDYVIFDNSPTLSLFTPSILAASDYVLMPTRMAYLDIDGINQQVEIMRNLAGMHDAQILGILPTQCTPNTLEYGDQLATLRQNYEALVWDDVQTTYSTIWAEASSVAKPVYRHAPSHKATEQIFAIGDRIIECLEGVKHVQ